MLPCNSIEAALRRPYTAPPLPLLPSPLCTVQQQQHVSRWQAKKENSGNIKFYESFTQIATLLPINASPARSKVVATSAPSCHCLAVPPFPSLSPSATVFCSVSFAIFILLQNVFVSTLLYLFCAHTKKVVCSPFNRPPPPPQPSFPHSLPCLATGNPSQMLPSTAAVPLFVAALSPLLSIRCCLYFLLLCLYACVCA